MARLIEHDDALATASSALSAEDTEASRGWPMLVAAPLAALAAFVLGAIAFALPTFALWLTMPEVGPEWDTWQEVARIAGLAWLAGQGFAVTVSGLLITLTPWGLLAINVGLLLLAGRWAARTAAVGTPLEALVVTAAGTVVFTGLSLGVATWIADPATGPGRVLLTSFTVSLCSFGLGVVQGARLIAPLRALTPASLRRILAAAGLALSLLIGAAAVAVGVSLVAHADQTHRLLIALAPDAAGFAVIVLLSLGYLPTLVIWGMSYLLGTGFTVSAGVVISPFTTTGEAPLPVFPLLGALPASAPPGAQVLPVIGLIAGMLAAGVLRRRGARGWALLGEAAAMVAVATALLWGLLVAATGSLGDGRLAEIGPIIGPTIGVAALLWGVGSLIIVVPALASAEPGEQDRAIESVGPREGREHGE